jgi:hypothetical protein
MDEANHATIGCAFTSDDSAVTALRALAQAGLVSAWRIGATDKERAVRIAQAAGAVADLDPADPLMNVRGVASGVDAMGGVNSGALVGGLAGAVVGFLAGNTPIGAVVPVDPSMRAVASALLFFAIGVAVGGVLGGALGKRPSTHAGFRLIDAMEAGAVAAIGSMEHRSADETRRKLHEGGASEILVIE